MTQRATARERPVIAIDGPSGAGKSTLAAHLARVFGYLNLETGAMYRAFALNALRAKRPLDAEAELVALAQTTRIELQPRPNGNQVLLDGRDVTEEVRSAEVTAAASKVSVHPCIRAWMVDQQRALGSGGGVVMEGRDIGTVVFPDAEVKLFLDASPEVRGQRRFLQTGPGIGVGTPQAVIAELRDRDARDQSRTESPLRVAAGAVVLDSTAMTLEQLFAESETIVRRHLRSIRG